jgi:hypothetical protein
MVFKFPLLESERRTHLKMRGAQRIICALSVVWAIGADAGMLADNTAFKACIATPSSCLSLYAASMPRGRAQPRAPADDCAHAYPDSPG